MKFLLLLPLLVSCNPTSNVYKCVDGRAYLDFAGFGNNYHATGRKCKEVDGIIFLEKVEKF